MTEKTELFSTVPYRRAVISMAVPCVISSLVLVVYNMADTFFVGQTGDPLQVAAVSLTNAVFVMYMAIANLTGIGGGTVVSVLLGANEEKRAKAASSFCCWGAIAAGVVTGALVLIFMEPLLTLLGAGPDTRAHARNYLFYIAAGAPFIFFANVFCHVVRGEGAAAASMVGGIIGTGVNIVLDPVFILMFGMGTAGAAVATVLGNICGCIYFVFYFKKSGTVLSVNPRYLRGNVSLMLRVVRVGAPAGVNSALMSMATILLNNALVTYGDCAVAAMGIVNKIYLFSAFVHMGITNGVQPLLGYCRGAGLKDRFMNVMKFSALLTIICGTVLAAVGIFFAPEVVRLFIDDGEVVTLGSRMLVLVSLASPILGVLFLTINTMQALERALPAAMISVCRQGFLFVPMLYILKAAIGLDGVSVTQTAVDYVTVAISLVLLMRILREDSMMR